MGEERLELSKKERDRLKVLHEVKRGHLSQVEAATRMGLSPRHVRRLLRRVEQEGDAGLVHGLRGRESNRKFSPKFKKHVLSEVEGGYSDFGPTLASEHLARKGLKLSRETLRKWRVESGLWRVRRRRVQAVHTWRARRSCFGELVMMDSSEYRWLEQRGPQLQLIAMIDDATSRLWGRFALADTTEENYRTLEGWLRQWGRPCALYTDKDSIYYPGRQPNLEEQLSGKCAQSQFGRALEELGIEWIAAHSPQAKGRVERLFGTLQDRLVKEMRLAGIQTLQKANEFFQESFLPFWDQRFTIEPRRRRDAHRSVTRSYKLESILSFREARTVDAAVESLYGSFHDRSHGVVAHRVVGGAHYGFFRIMAVCPEGELAVIGWKADTCPRLLWIQAQSQRNAAGLGGHALHFSFDIDGDEAAQPFVAGVGERTIASYGHHLDGQERV